MSDSVSKTIEVVARARASLMTGKNIGSESEGVKTAEILAEIKVKEEKTTYQ